MGLTPTLSCPALLAGICVGSFPSNEIEQKLLGLESCFFKYYSFGCLVFPELYDSVLGMNSVVLDSGVLLKTLVEKMVSMLWCEKHKLERTSLPKMLSLTSK